MTVQEQAQLPLSPALYDDEGRHLPLFVRAAVMLVALYLPYALLYPTDLWDTGRGRGLARVAYYLPGFVLYLFTSRAQRPTMGLPMLMFTGMCYFLTLIPRRPLAVAGMFVFAGAVSLLNAWLVFLYLSRRF